MILRVNLLSMFLLCLFPTLQAQKRIIKGSVVDGDGVPLVFASVILKGTDVGTSTDTKGEFYVESDEKHHTLIVSYVGFQTKEITIRRNISEVKITLDEGGQLDEVVVVTPPKVRLKKKENPAYRVMKSIWEKRHHNSLSNLKAYQYKKYTSIEAGVNNIDTLLIKKILSIRRKKTEKLSGLIDRNNNNSSKVYIPFDMKERIENYYGNNEIGKERIDIEAKRNTGLTNDKGFFSKKLGSVFSFINIYKNSFQLFNASFTSPISKLGFATYDYVLQDSIMVNGKKHYKIYYFPRRSVDMAFEGSFEVEAPSYALTRINMRFNKDNGVNLVNGFYAEQTYDIIRDDVYIPKENTYEVSYNPISRKDDSEGFYVYKKEIYSDFVIDKPHPRQFYDHSDTDDYAGQHKQSESYWKQTNLDDSNNISRNYISELKDNKSIGIITNLTNIISTGYVPLSNYLQYGKYWDAFTRNDVEGLRLNLGFRTFGTVDDRFRINSKFAFGLRDKVMKYGIDAKYLVDVKPRIILSGTIYNDYSQLSSSFLSLNQTMIGSPFQSRFLLTRGKNFYFTRVKSFSLGSDIEFAKNVHLGISISAKRYQSASKEAFDIGFLENGKKIDAYDAGGLSAYLLFTPSRQMVGLGVEQKSALGFYPTIFFRYSRKDKGFMSNFNYQKAQLLLSYPFMMGNLGVFSTTLQMGKIFGTVPITLLTPVPANQGFLGRSQTFSRLNYYDLITDTYLMFTATHYFGGFLFNKAPFISRARWRTHIFVRGVYGSVSDANKNFNMGDIPYNTPSESPYYEYGFGISNIGFKNYRFLRVDFVWRGDMPKGFVIGPRSSLSKRFGLQFNIGTKL